MKKQSIMNLVRYHVEKNEEAFISEVAEIAKEFDQSGDSAMANYLMELVSNANYYVPQSSYKNLHYLQKSIIQIHLYCYRRLSKKISWE